MKKIKLPEDWWNHIKPIPYKQLLIKRHQEHVAASRYTREQAIEMAKPYHLRHLRSVPGRCSAGLGPVSLQLRKIDWCL